MPSVVHLGDCRQEPWLLSHRRLAIGDWLNSYRKELIDLFQPAKRRLPSYSKIRRVLLNLDYQQYSAALARFFGVKPLPRRDLSDGRQGLALRGSYQLDTGNADSPPHLAIMMVSRHCQNSPHSLYSRVWSLLSV